MTLINVEIKRRSDYYFDAESVCLVAEFEFKDNEHEYSVYRLTYDLYYIDNLVELIRKIDSWFSLSNHKMTDTTLAQLVASVNTQ